MAKLIDQEHEELMASMIETGKTMLRARHELGPDAFWLMIDNDLKISRDKAVRKMRLALVAEAGSYAQ